MAAFAMAEKDSALGLQVANILVPEWDWHFPHSIPYPRRTTLLDHVVHACCLMTQELTFHLIERHFNRVTLILDSIPCQAFFLTCWLALFCRYLCLDPPAPSWFVIKAECNRRRQIPSPLRASGSRPATAGHLCLMRFAANASPAPVLWGQAPDFPVRHSIERPRVRLRLLEDDPAQSMLF